MELSILYFKGLSVKYLLSNDTFLSLKIVYIFENSSDPDEMPPYAAFHLCLYCLQNYLFIWYLEGKALTTLSTLNLML